MPIIAGLLVKILGLFGGSFLGPILKHYETKANSENERQRVWAGFMTNALTAEIEARRIGMEGRVKMLDNPVGAALLCLIVAPPALYSACVFGVTLIDSFFGIKLVVQSVPARFEDWGFKVQMTFLGGGSVIVAARSVAAKLKK